MRPTIGMTLGAMAFALAANTSTAQAFCGFYVSGSGEKMFADATQVVLMRDGTRTVLSMQNDYKGPLADFAMVIPVPVVLKEKDVKTLPKQVFHNTDSLGSPRLVEYWEQDPCAPDYHPPPMSMTTATMDFSGRKSADGRRESTVKIEAQFTVGEYQILILSATDSSGLDRWLRANSYKIPEGVEPLLRPYVEAGSKFFVAKVDPKKVQMVEGRAALSPIRFHYDSEEFALPIRLGMANSSGKQDLIVNIISLDKRYEVANYKNVFIPTNFDVKNEVRSRFGEFYAALFDKTLEANPGAVVTEYAWTATPQMKCDPCTDAVINNPDLVTLGGDIIGGRLAAGNFVLTRLHARYGAADMKDDLRFKEAKPVTGGREMWNGKGGLETGASASAQNFFQARYAIRHWWTGAVKCAAPQRGRWGGPPDGAMQQTLAANKTAFAPRGKIALGSMIGRDLPEIGVKRTVPAGGGGGFAKPPGGGAAMLFGFLGGLVLIGAGLFVRRRT